MYHPEICLQFHHHFEFDLSLNPSPNERDFAECKAENYTTLFTSTYLVDNKSTNSLKTIRNCVFLNTK